MDFGSDPASVDYAKLYKGRIILLRRLMSAVMWGKRGIQTLSGRRSLVAEGLCAFYGCEAEI